MKTGTAQPWSDRPTISAVVEQACSSVLEAVDPQNQLPVNGVGTFDVLPSTGSLGKLRKILLEHIGYDSDFQKSTVNMLLSQARKAIARRNREKLYHDDEKKLKLLRELGERPHDLEQICHKLNITTTDAGFVLASHRMMHSVIDRQAGLREGVMQMDSLREEYPDTFAHREVIAEAAVKLCSKDRVTGMACKSKRRTYAPGASDKLGWSNAAGSALETVLERDLATYGLTSPGDYATKAQLQDEAKQDGCDSCDDLATPDVVFKTPQEILGHKIKWIVAKNWIMLPGMSDLLPYKICDQVAKYTQQFGPGAILWGEKGFVENIDEAFADTKAAGHVFHFCPSLSEIDATAAEPNLRGKAAYVAPHRRNAPRFLSRPLRVKTFNASRVHPKQSALTPKPVPTPAAAQNKVIPPAAAPASTRVVVEEEEEVPQFSGVYVSDIKWSSTHDSLEKKFSDFGTIKNVTFEENKVRRATKSAFIEFTDAKSVQKAIEASVGFGISVDDRKLKVEGGQSRTQNVNHRGVGVAAARTNGMVAIDVLGHLLWFDDTKGFGFIRTREHGDVFVHSTAKDKAGHLRVWETACASKPAQTEDISPANQLEFDLRPLPGKPPVAVNLRAAPSHTRNKMNFEGAEDAVFKLVCSSTSGSIAAHALGSLYKKCEGLRECIQFAGGAKHFCEQSDRLDFISDSGCGRIRKVSTRSVKQQEDEAHEMTLRKGELRNGLDAETDQLLDEALADTKRYKEQASTLAEALAQAQEEADVLRKVKVEADKMEQRLAEASAAVKEAEERRRHDSDIVEKEKRRREDAEERVVLIKKEVEVKAAELLKHAQRRANDELESMRLEQLSARQKSCDLDQKFKQKSREFTELKQQTEAKEAEAARAVELMWSQLESMQKELEQAQKSQVVVGPDRTQIARWECEIDGGEWVAYSNVISERLEQAYTARKATTFDRDRWKYTVEWTGPNAGTQTNTKTAVQRLMRRTVKTVSTTDDTTGAFPENWTPNPPGRICELVSVAVDSPEWSEVKRLVHKTRPEARLTHVDRIQNQALWRLYQARREELQLILGEPPLELTVWHGTKHTNPEKIYKDQQDGFMMQLSQQGMWGKGIYFADKFAYSDNYAHNIPGGEKQLLLVKLLAGNMIALPSDSRLNHPPDRNDGSELRYDTVKGNTQNSDVYIVYENKRAYPQYCVRYHL